MLEPAWHLGDNQGVFVASVSKHWPEITAELGTWCFLGGQWFWGLMSFHTLLGLPSSPFNRWLNWEHYLTFIKLDFFLTFLKVLSVSWETSLSLALFFKTNIVILFERQRDQDLHLLLHSPNAGNSQG